MVTEMHIADDAAALIDAINHEASISEVRPLSRALVHDAHVIEHERSGVQQPAKRSLSDRFAHARSSSNSLSATRDEAAREVHRSGRGDARA